MKLLTEGLYAELMETCVDVSEDCPCGLGAMACEGELKGLCLPATETDISAPAAPCRTPHRPSLRPAARNTRDITGEDLHGHAVHRVEIRGECLLL